MTLWYLIRALGMVALLAFTASTALGALSVVGSSGVAGADRRLVRQLVHRSVAVLALVVLGLHIVCSVLDSFVTIPVTAALLPFGSGYRPLAVGIGVLGMYAVIVAALSGAVRGRLATAGDAAARAWRVVHMAAYAGWALSVVHGLTAGSDTQRWWGLAVYVGCVLVVLAAVLVRFVGDDVRRVTDHRGHRRLLLPGGPR